MGGTPWPKEHSVTGNLGHLSCPLAELFWVRRSFFKSCPGKFRPDYQVAEVERQGSVTEEGGQVTDYGLSAEAPEGGAVSHTPPHHSVGQADGGGALPTPPDYHRPRLLANAGSFQNLARPSRPRPNPQTSAQCTLCWVLGRVCR